MGEAKILLLLNKNFIIQANNKMSSVKDVDQQKFVVGFADFLKKSGKMQVPEWADLIKLPRFNEQGPHNPDWFFVRASSVARHLYIRSPAGVGSFTKIYGARKRNGSAPSHFMRSSQSVSRRILQALEEMSLVEMDANCGRKLTSQGRRDMDRIAAQIAKARKDTGERLSIPRLIPCF